ncbi:MAG: BON domain-containing protein [Thermoanaerobaculia bacterium]
MTNDKRITFVSISLLLVAMLTACSQEPGAVAQRKMRSAFGEDAKLIEVKIEGSTATLTGTVSERSTQELAEEVARSIPGVTSVNNRLTGPQARGLDKLRTEAMDAALEMSVKGALVRDAGSSVAQALEIEAADGVVSLRGTVSTGESRNGALATAGRVEGVRKVVDLIEVGASSK